MVAEYAKRRDLICGLLDGIPQLKYVKPQGAFYVLVDISATGQNSTQFAERLLDKQKVAVVPGIAFGDDKTVRLSYATSRENIERRPQAHRQLRRRFVIGGAVHGRRSRLGLAQNQVARWRLAAGGLASDVHVKRPNHRRRVYASLPRAFDSSQAVGSTVEESFHVLFS